MLQIHIRIKKKNRIKREFEDVIKIDWTFKGKIECLKKKKTLIKFMAD